MKQAPVIQFHTHTCKSSTYISKNIIIIIVHLIIMMTMSLLCLHLLLMDELHHQ